MFALYKTIKARQVDSISIENMTNFAKDFGLVPDMLSKPEIARLFRGVQDTTIHYPVISLQDYERLCCFIGIYHFSKTNSSTIMECLENFFHCLEMNSGILERTYGASKKNPRVESFS
jgi:hypothetical protein